MRDEDVLEEGEKRGPFIYVLAVLLVLLMVIFIIPVGSIKWISQPKDIPDVNEVLVGAPESGDLLKLGVLGNARDLEITPFLKHVGSRIASSCEGVSENCYSKAMYLFVRDNIKYVQDPDGEYIEGPKAVLLSGSADCDGQAVLLYALLKSVGVESRIAVTNDHAFVQANLPTKSYFYRPVMRWVSMDPTCKSCDIGEVDSRNLNEIVGYV